MGKNHIQIIKSSRDLLLFGLDSGKDHLSETLKDLSEEEYIWEPLPPSEQVIDRLLPPEQKRVWRVYQKEQAWTYDYTPEDLDPCPFTTIAWILNHLAQTADMYLYCIRSGKPEGEDRSWEDLPVPSNLETMRKYAFEVLAEVVEYLIALSEEQIHTELNKLTPAPWGEMRPTYVNIWGGIIEHVIQHAMQIAVRKEGIRNFYRIPPPF